MASGRLGRLYWTALALGSCLLLGAIAAWGGWPLAADGRVAITDFATVWAGGVRAVSGQGALVYDLDLHEAYYAALIHQPAANGLTFGYPPTALLLFAPFGLLPYGAALPVYLLLGAAAWFAALRGITRNAPVAIGMTFAFGGATQTILLGQNGFLSAAAIAGGLQLLPRRPHLAGVLFGLLAVKPHLGLALAPFLLVRREWAAIGSAAATVGAMAGAATILWGMDIWPQYFAASREIAAIVASRTDSIVAGKMQSVLAILADHLPLSAALAVHALAALGALGAVIALVRRRASHGVQAAGVIAATLLVTPYSFLYDCTMLTAAAAFLLTRSMAQGERTLLLAAMVLPGLWFFTAEPFVPLVCAVILGLCWRLAAAPPTTAPGPSGPGAALV
ncbi:MAG: DUF2029 domain-containing protein [Sphingomonadales bacterium]|nr:DUF2029 domain-containing protein [Sphingomonadales bacterium]MBD3772906.1 DUF2029 domain-containing protein [Paracoccaceae bacterium]